MLLQRRGKTGQANRFRQLVRPWVLRLYAWKQDLLVFLIPAMARYHRLPFVGWSLRRAATLYARTTYHTGSVVPFETVQKLVRRGERFAVAICACRKIWKHCDVSEIPPTCLYVGLAAETWTRFKKHEAREIDRKEAIGILEYCRSQHLVHTLWTCTTPETYAICSCCPVDCAGMQLRRAGIPEGSRPSPFVSWTERELCDACGLCVEFCHSYPFGARNLVDGEVHVDQSRCVGCGVCREVCTSGAIELRLRGEQGGARCQRIDTE